MKASSPLSDMTMEVSNLLLNMSAGLLPENLTESEIACLAEQFGDDWFTYLGYTDPPYRNPNSIYNIE